VQRLEGHDSRINDVAFSPDGGTALSAADDKQVILWDTATGAALWRSANPTDTMNAVVFSPDGRLFAAGAGTFRFAAAAINPDEADFSVTIWETETQAETAHLQGHKGPVTALAFSPDSRQLLSGSIDTTLQLWDVGSGKQLQRLVGHTSGVMSVAFAPGGRYATSGSQDGSVLLWDLDGGDLLRRISGHEGVVHHVDFAGDNDRVWSGAEDGWIKQWNLAPDLTALLAWTQSNRYIPALPCDQYARYGLAEEGACAATE
jgi:WD40 repeat protein